VLFNDTVTCCDYIESVIDEEMSMEHWWNVTDRRRLKYLGKKTFPTVTLSTTNHTYTGLGSNLVLSS